MSERNSVRSSYAFNIYCKNYLFTTSFSQNGYCYSEKWRDENGKMNSIDGQLVKEKSDVISSIKFELLGDECKIKTQKDHDFLLSNIKLIPENRGKYRMFFYDNVREAIWEELKEGILTGIYSENIDLFDYNYFRIVDEVEEMEVNKAGNMVVLHGITYSEGNFPSSIIIDLNSFNKYVDIKSLIEKVELVENTTVISLTSKLHKDIKYSDKDNLIKDLPIILNCNFTPNDDNTTKKISITKLFNNNEWEGNLASIIK